MGGAALDICARGHFTEAFRAPWQGELTSTTWGAPETCSKSTARPCDLDTAGSLSS